MKTMASLTFAAATAVALCLPLHSLAQAWPTKQPIKLVVPFAAGGPSDAVARALAKGLSEGIGQTVVVDNRTGAGGSIGIDAVAKSPPDGYTLGFAHTGTTAINPNLFAKHPFDPLTDLTPITPVVSYANVLVVNPQVPAKTVAEFVAWAKANPTQASYASGGNGATNHLSGELFKSITGTPLAHIPYKGNAPAMSALIAGTVPAMFDIPVTVLPQLKAGKVRALAITGTKRSAYLPGVPTMREAGYPGFEEAGSDLWFGLVGPAGMPKELVDRIHAETLKALKTPALEETIHTMAYDVWTISPSEFKTFLRNDHAKWGKVVKLSGAKVE